MEIRRASEGDLPAEQEVFRAPIGELFRGHAFEPPDSPPVGFEAQHRHLLRHDGERCFAAEEGGRVVGFSAAFAGGDAWFLSSLFVLPEAQGRGVGRRLLEHSLGDGYRRRLTLADSIQPVSNGLYVRRGLLPATPVLHLDGEPRTDASGGLEAATLEADALASLDRAAYGFDRAVDHAYWRAGPATGTLWLRDGDPCAYSYVWPGGRIGPIAGADGAAAADGLRTELARADGTAGVVVPGSAPLLVRLAVDAGLRFTKPPGLLLLCGEATPPAALALSSYTLF